MRYENQVVQIIKRVFLIDPSKNKVNQFHIQSPIEFMVAL